MLTLVYTSSLLFLCSAGCAKLYVRAHADQLRSAAAVVACAESNFWDERAEETGSWLWLTKICAKRRALMMRMASSSAPAPLGLGAQGSCPIRTLWHSQPTTHDDTTPSWWCHAAAQELSMLSSSRMRQTAPLVVGLAGGLILMAAAFAKS
eukprot:1160464-Pelagomonas_calceolata.AAC.12